MTMPTDVGEPELGKLALWEAGRARLGYGDWAPGDRDDPDAEPFQKYAGMQAHRLFMVMRKRNISQETFLLCVDYCARHHIRIENAIWVFKYDADARKEKRELARERPTEIGALIEAALFHERGHPGKDHEKWLTRLAGAQGSARGEVFLQWCDWHNLTANDLTA